MANAKGKKANGAKKGAKSQSVEIPTLMGAMQGLNREAQGFETGRAPRPRIRKDPRITPKFRKLR